LTPAPPGKGAVKLSVIGPSNASSGVRPDVALGGERITEFGVRIIRLDPGTYTLTARSVVDDRYSYDPSPSSETISLRAGEGVDKTVTYTCATGAAQATIVPPEGLAVRDGTVKLQSGSFTQDVPGSGGIIPRLSPGTWAVTAQSIRYLWYTYDPQITPTSFQLSPCETKPFTVAYRPVTGALRVVVNRDGTMTSAPSVKVSGPGLLRYISSTTLFENITPGAYAVEPQDVLEDGVRFRGTATPPDPTVNAGPPEAVSTVQYAPVSGKLTVRVVAAGNGEPPQNAHPAPRVSISGPQGFSASIASYGDFAYPDRTPGTYSILAQAVAGRYYTYVPTPASTTEELQAGERPLVEVRYAPADGTVSSRVLGVPTGAVPRVYLDGNQVNLSSGPSGWTALISYVPPGGHTVTADPISHSGYVYAASPVAFTVSASETASVTLQYEKQQRLPGRLTAPITASGLVGQTAGLASAGKGVAADA